MPTGTPDVPLDSRGKPLAGVALEGHLRRQAELAAAESYAEDIRAVARMVARLAGRLLSMPPPDAMAVLGTRGGAEGQQDASRVLRAAGINPEAQRQRWAEQAPVQVQSSTGPGWDGDPDHHPEVIALLTTPGVPMSAITAKIAEVAERKRTEREEAAAANRPGVLWVTREGEELHEGGPATPLRPQRSYVRRSVPDLGPEPPAA